MNGDNRGGNSLVMVDVPLMADVMPKNVHIFSLATREVNVSYIFNLCILKCWYIIHVNMSDQSMDVSHLSTKKLFNDPNLRQGNTFNFVK